MKESLFEQIKRQTLQASELAGANEIEQCHVILSLRQQSLEELHKNYLLFDNVNEKNKQYFIELLLWIQAKDTPVIQSLEEKKEVFKQDFLTQTKRNKALQHYKNIT